MLKLLSAFKWVHRPTAHPEIRIRSKWASPVLKLLLGTFSVAACSSAQTPTVLNVGTTDAPGAQKPIAGTDLRGPLTPNAIVRSVTDGDTITIELSNTETLNTETDAATFSQIEKLRLIGIDTPETKRPNTPIECFAAESDRALRQLLPNQTPVFVELDIEHRDRYGRLLGYVFRAGDGLFVNHEMVRSGMAASLTFPPNVAYSDQFFQAAEAARGNNVGLWSRCASEHEPLAKIAKQ
jgi:micrococcal nuclease